MKRMAWMAAALCVAAGVVMAGCGGSGAKPAASSAPVQKYIIGTAANTPKWSEEGDNGGIQGFDIDVFNEIAKRNHWEIEWRNADFSALWGMLDNGQILTIANDTTKNAQREQKYNFSDIYAYGGYLFMTKPDYPAKDDGIESFRGKTVAVDGVTNMRLALEKQNEEKQAGVNILYLESQPAALLSVVNGQADAAYVSRSSGYIAINSLKMNLAAHDAHFRHNPICYAFRRTPEDDKAREAVNKALDSMRKDGTLKKMSEKWFGTDFTYLPKEE